MSAIPFRSATHTVRHLGRSDRRSERPVFSSRQRPIFACLADPVTTAAGRRWFVGTRRPNRPDLLPLYDFKHPRSPHQEATANLLSTPDRQKRHLNPKARRSPQTRGEGTGGARRDRTDDLMLAKHALSQLSYGPVWEQPRAVRPARPTGRPR